MRTLQFAASKLVSLEILVHLSQYLSDSDKLHIILPFVCNALEDSELQVAEYSFESVCQILHSLDDPFESINDINLYKAFIWPTFAKCAKNADIHRVFIQQSVSLARTCIRLG